MRGATVGGRPGEVRLAAAVGRQIRAHGGEAYPEECCGGLLGRLEAGDGPEAARQVLAAVPVRNARGEDRRRRYLIGPDTVLRLEDQAEGDGLEVLGFYHSHPDHSAEPSEFDREHAWPWYRYLILSVRGGRPRELRAWTLAPDRSRFFEAGLVEPEAGPGPRSSTAGRRSRP